MVHAKGRGAPTKKCHGYKVGDGGAVARHLRPMDGESEDFGLFLMLDRLLVAFDDPQPELTRL